MTDRDGSFTLYGYDAANRITSLAGCGGKIDYTYDDVGNMTAASEGQDTTSYAYDALNRLSQVSSNGKVFNYSYDPAGRLSNRLYPNGISTNYLYNNCNWLTMVLHQRSSAPLLSFQYRYNRVGERTSKVIESGFGRSLWKYRYDRVGRLISEKHQKRYVRAQKLPEEDIEEEDMSKQDELVDEVLLVLHRAGILSS